METVNIVIFLILIAASISLIAYAIIHRITHKKYTKNSFKTKHNIRIKPSPKTSFLKIELVEKWTDQLINFWQAATNWSRNSIEKSLSNCTITMYDQHYLVITRLNSDGKVIDLKANGITYPDNKIINIASLPKNYSGEKIKERIYSLYRHEVSHIVAGYVGEFWDEDKSHQLFKDINLGA